MSESTCSHPIFFTTSETRNDILFSQHMCHECLAVIWEQPYQEKVSRETMDQARDAMGTDPNSDSSPWYIIPDMKNAEKQMTDEILLIPDSTQVLEGKLALQKALQVKMLVGNQWIPPLTTSSLIQDLKSFENEITNMVEVWNDEEKEAVMYLYLYARGMTVDKANSIRARMKKD